MNKHERIWTLVMAFLGLLVAVAIVVPRDLVIGFLWVVGILCLVYLLWGVGIQCYGNKCRERGLFQSSKDHPMWKGMLVNLGIVMLCLVPELGKEKENGNS